MFSLPSFNWHSMISVPIDDPLRELGPALGIRQKRNVEEIDGTDDEFTNTSPVSVQGPKNR